MSKVSVLISCMFQNARDIILRSNIQTDVVIVNQCDINNTETFDFLNKKGEVCNAYVYHTQERGLSKSRNRAIMLSENAEICIVCDDDEVFPDNYEEFVYEKYRANNTLDLALFAIDWDNKVFPGQTLPMNMHRILRTSSQQITFRRKVIVENNIHFDELMGSGTGNGGGEENKFLLDCYRLGLNMNYFPDLLAKIIKGKSQWFHGFTETFFQNQGWTVRRLLGDFWGYLYVWYYVVRHYSLYKNDITPFSALKNIHIGYFDNRGK